jgi:Fe-coproporphyrin III synthase
MLDVSVLYGGLVTDRTPRRYGCRITELDPSAYQRMAAAPGVSQRLPVVVWNLTRTCNLSCIRCNTDSQGRSYPGELTTDECRIVLDDLRDFGVHTVVFSGGEPLVRADFFEIASHARELGLRVVLSTNGTLIDQQAAEQLSRLKFAYVGIGLESIVSDVHDTLRGVKGAFDQAMGGLRRCVDAGQEVGLRLALAEHTCRDLSGSIEFFESEQIKRACYYHLQPIGRGRRAAYIRHIEMRRAVNRVCDLAGAFSERGRQVDILTSGNSCDGPYLYLRMLREGHFRTEQVWNMLAWNGGARYSAGVGIGYIDSLGTVHACQFSGHRSFGNVRRRRFSEIWRSDSDPILVGLRDRLSLLKGRCGTCRFKALCGGSSRVRAEIVTGDPWAPDPACYLINDEISEKPRVGKNDVGYYESGGNRVPH